MKPIEEEMMKPRSEMDEALKPTLHATPSSVQDDIEEGNDHESNPSKSSNSTVTDVILKIPALTWIYWGEKMTATTFGETFADFWSQTLGLGYGATSATLMSIFIVFLAFQVYVKTYVPPLFWAVMATSSIAGTLFSDFIDRTLGWGYPVGMAVLLSILLAILGVWKLTGLHMNVEGAMNRSQEIFYWSAILVSNTLGTAMGDFIADSLDAGFAITAGSIGAVLVVLALLAYFTKLSRVVLFWVAFILTRPFGATFGDLLTKPKDHGGLDLGTGWASLVIFGLFVIFFLIELYTLRQNRRQE